MRREMSDNLFPAIWPNVYINQSEIVRRTVTMHRLPIMLPIVLSFLHPSDKLSTHKHTHTHTHTHTHVRFVCKFFFFNSSPFPGPISRRKQRRLLGDYCQSNTTRLLTLEGTVVDLIIGVYRWQWLRKRQVWSFKASREQDTLSSNAYKFASRNFLVERNTVQSAISAIRKWCKFANRSG